MKALEKETIEKAVKDTIEKTREISEGCMWI